jgi:peptide/nickel transport system permease protein
MQRRTALGLAIVIGLIFIGIFANFVATRDPFEMSDDFLNAPSLKYLMGTDHLGRDIYSRIIYGTRVSLLFAFGAAGISLFVSLLLGAIPGYYGGLIDDVLSRANDFFLMIPRLVLIIFIVALFGPSLINAMIIVGFTIWPSNARIVRAQVLTLKQRDFVQAAIGSGASTFRVITKHILPNGMLPIIANSMLQISSAVILEASLSFLGLGDANQVSWGQILYKGQFHLLSAWWMTVFPGVFIFILVFGFNMLGEGISLGLSSKSA